MNTAVYTCCGVLILSKLIQLTSRQRDKAQNNNGRLHAIRQALEHAFSSGPDIIPSPEKTVLPFLTESEIAVLPYPLDALPGGRWEDTPYGRIRVYEFGPEKGKKVVYVHGISTPCISGREILLKLAAEGCHVMTFDLPGRGYSSSTSAVQGKDFFNSLILHLISPWSEGSSVLTPIAFIGYSLGGGLIASFAIDFPDYVEDLIFICGGGLITTNPFPMAYRLGYRFAPKWLLTLIVYWIYHTEVTTSLDSINPEARAEIHREINEQDGVDVVAATNWQYENHQGFARSYTSSFIHCPNFYQDQRWKKLRGQHVMAFFGTEDWIVPSSILQKMTDVIGQEYVMGIVYEGVGHELPAVRPRQITAELLKRWQL